MVAYEQKTKVTEHSVIEFIENIEHEQKKKDAYALLEIFTEASGFPPKMWGTSIIGFGRYHYTYASGHSGEAALVGFSPRKTKISLYIASDIPEREELLAKLGKHTVGKACVYVNKLSDIDPAILKQFIKRTIEHLQELYPEEG